MSTVGDYRADIRNLGGLDGQTDPSLDSAIADARQEVMRKRRWTYALKRDTTQTTAANNDTVTLAIADLDQLEAIYYVSGATVYDLDYLEPNEFRSQQANDATTSRGMPSTWTRLGGDLLFYPTPDRAYPLYIDYVRGAVALGSTPSTTDTLIPDKDRGLVVWLAIESIAFRQRDPFALQWAGERVRECLREAVARDDIQQRQDADQVKPFWGRPSYYR
jgi:hypothetical protein